jgi:preprotein translocase subunit SecE
MSEKEKIEQTAPAKEEQAKKTEKTEKKAKTSFVARIVKWLRELKSELKKVQWPSKKQTINNTLIVIACVLIVGMFIWVFDALATGVISAIIALFKG